MTAIHQSPIVVRPFPGSCRRNARSAFLRDLALVLSESYRPRVLLDLSGTMLTDTAAIDLLLGCIDEITGRDGDLNLVAPFPQTRLVLELTRIDRVVRVFASREEAALEGETAELTAPERMPPNLFVEGETRWVA